MDWYRQASIIANDLDSMVHRIEALPAHPGMTDAMRACQEAKAALQSAMTGIHQQEMLLRHSGAA